MYYYLATNRWGGGRAYMPGNGWDVFAYDKKADRDKEYDALDYEHNGVSIPKKKQIEDIFGGEFCVGAEMEPGKHLVLIAK